MCGFQPQLPSDDCPRKVQAEVWHHVDAGCQSRADELRRHPCNLSMWPSRGIWLQNVMLSGPLSTCCLEIAAFTAPGGVFKQNYCRVSSQPGAAFREQASFNSAQLLAWHWEVLAKHMQSIPKYHSTFLCMHFSMGSVPPLILSRAGCLQKWPLSVLM